jgi:chromosome segregation ATPase
MAQKPSISAHPDDAGSRHRAGKRRRGSGGDGPRMLGANLIMAVLVAGLMVAGWFIANQHQLLKDGQTDLESASARIAVLEDRLRVTDEAMTETGQDTQEKLGFWETEVRKLWAITNERNRKWIKDNEANIGRMQKSLGTVESGVRDLNSAVGRHDAAFAQQQDIIDRLASVQLQIQQMANSQRDLTDKVNASRQELSSLQSGLAGRVADNEQAVTAIDAYRIQLNNRLAGIERRLDGLSATPGY